MKMPARKSLPASPKGGELFGDAFAKRSRFFPAGIRGAKRDLTSFSRAKVLLNFFLCGLCGEN
jgi:hypothetical protein